MGKRGGCVRRRFGLTRTRIELAFAFRSFLFFFFFLSLSRVKRGTGQWLYAKKTNEIHLNLALTFCSWRCPFFALNPPSALCGYKHNPTTQSGEQSAINKRTSIYHILVMFLSFPSSTQERTLSLHTFALSLDDAFRGETKVKNRKHSFDIDEDSQLMDHKQLEQGAA